MSTLSSALVIPDSLLAKEATDLLREHSTDLLFNHSIRVYLFAAEQGRQQKLRFDPELLYVAAAFHDFGLIKKFSSPDERFEVDGANAARQFLTALRFLKNRYKLHGKPLLCTPLPASLSTCALKWLYSIRESVSMCLEKASISFLRAHKPGTTYGTVNASICERLIPGYEAPNACDVIAASPFPDSASQS